MKRQRINAVRFMLNYIEMISSSVQFNLYYAPFIMSLILSKTSFPVRACTIKQNSYQAFGATKQVLLANDEGDEAPHEHDDVPPQPQPQGPPLDPLMPQILNVIQQGMQDGMANFTHLTMSNIINWLCNDLILSMQILVLFGVMRILSQISLDISPLVCNIFSSSSWGSLTISIMSFLVVLLLWVICL
jgi:hypothetical protein